MNTKQKLDNLVKMLKGIGSVLVAFPGGVDSTFLAKIAQDVLGNKAVAVTEISAFLSDSEKKMPKD